MKERIIDALFIPITENNLSSYISSFDSSSKNVK